MTKRVRRGMAVIAAMLLIMLDISSAYAAPEADDKEPDMDAGGAVLMEKDTGIVLLSKNAHQKLPMASTTKIMTALVVIENCSLGETVEVASKAYGVEGSSMYLKAGEKISVEDLLYGLMLLSGGRCACHTHSRHCGGLCRTYEQKSGEHRRAQHPFRHA